MGRAAFAEPLLVKEEREGALTTLAGAKAVQNRDGDLSAGRALWSQEGIGSTIPSLVELH